MNNLSSYPVWNLIIIKDPEALPGKTLINVLDLIQSVIHFRYVILNDINGAFVAPLIKQEGKIIEINSIKNIISNVKQFDWGDFFLFKEYPENWDSIKNTFEYPEYIIKSDTTVRAVDDTYVYVYTPYQEVVNSIKNNNFILDSIRSDYLENLEYPY